MFSVIRAFLAAAAVIVVALASSRPVDAAVAPLFDRTHARPGDRVAVSAGYVGTDATARRIVLYLVPLGLAARFSPFPAFGPPTPAPGPPPTLRGVVRLGHPQRSNDLGAGALAFRVPRAAHGRYTLGVWCGTCAPGGNHWAMASETWAGNPHAILTVDRAP